MSQQTFPLSWLFGSQRQEAGLLLTRCLVPFQTHLPTPPVFPSWLQLSGSLVAGKLLFWRDLVYHNSEQVAGKGPQDPGGSTKPVRLAFCPLAPALHWAAGTGAGRTAVT